jgi:trigger factor
MQITEIVSEGLRREFKVVIPAVDLDERLTGRIEEMKPKVHLKGFRPGKAPVSFLKKTYGKSMMGEIVQDAVNESSEKAVKDNSLKPALPPRVDLVSELQQVVDGKSDLEFTLKVDLMPDFEVSDVAKLTVERLVGEVGDEDVEAEVKRLAELAKTWTAREEGAAAEQGDLTVIDYVGKVDGQEFAGGKGQDFNLQIGNSALIAGFDEQLVGARKGETREVKVTFPSDYPEQKLAGKPAVFDVTVKEIKQPDPLQFDDELAKKFGLNTLDELKERSRESLKGEFSRASRMHLKRRVLDALDAAHAFPLPPAMVETEFSGIWSQVEAELKREGKTPADEGKSEDELKKEYRGIAERRVRLGLVLSKVGEQNGLTVSQEEIQRAVSARARAFPGQEQQVIKYYTSSPQALAELRAPLFEEKVVDFIAELAQVNDRKVSREILFLDPDEAAEKLKAE